MNYLLILISLLLSTKYTYSQENNNQNFDMISFVESQPDDSTLLDFKKAQKECLNTNHYDDCSRAIYIIGSAAANVGYRSGYNGFAGPMTKINYGANLSVGVSILDIIELEYFAGVIKYFHDHGTYQHGPKATLNIAKGMFISGRYFIEKQPEYFAVENGSNDYMKTYNYSIEAGYKWERDRGNYKIDDKEFFISYGSNNQNIRTITIGSRAKFGTGVPRSKKFLTAP